MHSVGQIIYFARINQLHAGRNMYVIASHLDHMHTAVNCVLRYQVFGRRKICQRDRGSVLTRASSPPTGDRPPLLATAGR